MTGSARPSWRGCLTGIVAITLFMAALYLLSSNAATATKAVGAVLSFIPEQLGLIEKVDPDQIYAIPEPPEGEVLAPVSIRRAGRYFLYTDDTTTMLNLTQAQVPWLKVVSETTGEELLVDIVRRGQMPFDTLAAPGRPIFTVDIPDPDRYGIYITSSAPRESFALVPDTVTGQEGKIWSLYLLQIAILASPFVWRRWQSRRHRQSRVAQNRADKLGKMEQMKEIRRRQRP